MPTQAPPTGVQLPAGWTYHELSGRPFYYHAATNTTRQELPPTDASEVIANYMYPAAPAPQLPSPQLQEQTQPQVEPEPPQPQVVHQALIVPEPVSYSMAPPPSSSQQAQQMLVAPLPTSPEEERRIDPMLGGRSVTFGEYLKAHDGQGFDSAQLAGIWGQLYPAIQVQAPSPPAAGVCSLTGPGSQQPQLQAMLPTAATNQPMTQLRVLVPEPGLRAGQQLAFTAPAAGPGMQPQKMMVRVNQDVVPGSMLTVQYPRPQGALPQPAIQVTQDDDQRQSKTLWVLYFLGFLFLSPEAANVSQWNLSQGTWNLPPATVALWITAVCLHYCKPEQRRSQYTRSRMPAMASGITCLACTLIVVVVLFLDTLPPQTWNWMLTGVQGTSSTTGGATGGTTWGTTGTPGRVTGGTTGGSTTAGTTGGQACYSRGTRVTIIPGSRYAAESWRPWKPLLPGKCATLLEDVCLGGGYKLVTLDGYSGEQVTGGYGEHGGSYVPWSGRISGDKYSGDKWVTSDHGGSYEYTDLEPCTEAGNNNNNNMVV